MHIGEVVAFFIMKFYCVNRGKEYCKKPAMWGVEEVVESEMMGDEMHTENFFEITSPCPLLIKEGLKILKFNFFCLSVCVLAFSAPPYQGGGRGRLSSVFSIQKYSSVNIRCSKFSTYRHIFQYPMYLFYSGLWFFVETI